eukprot:GEMP01017860.1.p1 GENE.GEMP01017860.1~~GEMP01017860.1.p1  ORF type:complete len:483 (+),score=75.33 GEMP01017860.1:154-1602(+)
MGLFGAAKKSESRTKLEDTQAVDTSDKFIFIGKEVHLTGSGKWWDGACKYRAIIQDIRDSDHTVKVQYMPGGGFKRFPEQDFFEHLLSDETNYDYGTQGFEWYHETYMPDSNMLDTKSVHLEKLREEISAAARKGDFAEAHKLKTTFIKTQSHLCAELNLRNDLLAAVRAEDFLKAQELKTNLEKMLQAAEDSHTVDTKAPPLSEVIAKAGKRALGGGIAGAMAMVVQVSSLMWMRTTMNYQYRYGTSTTEALKTLYADGGIRRFYRGIGPAMLQGPLSRFGDTAANAGCLALMDSNDTTRNLPAAIKTIGASATAATWRIFLTPIDTCKTILQVEGKQGLTVLFDKAKVGGPTVYYHGALAAAAATFAGHYPWFATYNTLDANIPVPQDKLKKLARNAGMGFVSSVVSDTISNSLRVIKTYRQTSAEKITYADTIRRVVEKDGYIGLFGRGLKTRILTNGMQGLMFSVMWKHFDEKIRARF